MPSLMQDAPLHEAAEAESEESIQLVSFKLASEEYGIEINKVREIILLGEITEMPQTPAYVKGLINLRSTVIPIVDLALKFDLPLSEPTEETRIVVVNVLGKTIGIVVDAVSEVLRISKSQIAPPPPTVAGIGQEQLIGLAKMEDRLLILLDIEKSLVGAGEAEASAMAFGEAF